MFNRITICGRITQNPELRQTDNGRAYVRFTLAVNSVYNKQTDFIPVVAWNQAAENLVNYQGKGSLILVDGQLQVRSVGEEGNRRVYFDVVANRIVYMETRKIRDQKKEDAKTSTTSAGTSVHSAVSFTQSPASSEPVASTVNNDTTETKETSQAEPSTNVKTNEVVPEKEAVSQEMNNETEQNSPQDNEDDGIFWEKE